jgi:NADH:ubiquinone oxidoreductase subunit E
LKTAEKISTFCLKGRVVGFVGDFEEKAKRIRVATAEGERYIKLSKELRYSLRKVLQPGDWIEISGIQKYKSKTGELKLKAFEVKLAFPTSQESVFKPPVAATKTKPCVMVCQKSSCQKRGAGEVCQAVQESLRDRGLEDQVAIKGTGCMKECKRGPCVVFMPDKTRYSGIAPKQVPTLIEKHFAAKLIPEGSEPELAPVT